VKQGTFIFSDQEWQALVDDLELSQRQEQIARGVLSGMSDKELSENLGISLPTIRTHIGRLFYKFEVDNRVGMVLRFVHQFRQQYHPLPES
jgi:DNA-binding CsgD family transcriptional regulator